MPIGINVRVIALFLSIFIVSILAFHQREGSLSHQLKKISGDWKGPELTLSLRCSQLKGSSFGQCKIFSSEEPKEEETWTLYREREGKSVFLLSASESRVLGDFSLSFHPIIYSDMKALTLVTEQKHTTFYRSPRSAYENFRDNWKYFFYLSCVLTFALLGRAWIGKESKGTHKKGKVTSNVLKKYE